MSADPAIEARKLINEMHGPCSLRENTLMTKAARAALAPIREVLDQLAEDTHPPCEFGKRYDLYEKAISALSPLVYTTEELSNDPN